VGVEIFHMSDSSRFYLWDCVMPYTRRSTLVVLLLFFCCVVRFAFAEEPGKVDLIAPWKAYSLSHKTGSPHTVIIDVRGKEAYAKCHIEGSLNIPAFILTKKNFPKSWHLVLVCSSLAMKDSTEAAGKLIEKGVRNVDVLDGGMDAWAGCGLPIVGDRHHEVRAVMAENLIWALDQDAGVSIVDIRSNKEFTAGHVPGARNMPVPDANKVPPALQKFLSSIVAQDRRVFEKRLLTLPAEERRMAKPYALTTVVLVGRPGPEAERFTRLLHVKGFTNVRFLYGGFEAVRGLLNKKGLRSGGNKI